MAVALPPIADPIDRRLALARAVTAAVLGSSSVEDAYTSAADAVFEHTAYSGVCITRVLPDSGLQEIVADRSRSSATLVGMRRALGEGLVGACILSGDQLVLGTAADDPRYSWPAATRFQSLLMTPIMRDGRCEAVLELADVGEDRFTADDAALMRTVADQLALGLRGVRARQDSERRAEHLEVAAAVTRAVWDATSAEEALRIAAELLFSATDYQTVTAHVVRRAQGTRVAVADLDRIEPPRPESVTAVGAGIIGRVIHSGRQELLDSAVDDPSYQHSNRPEYRSAVVTPVMVDGACHAAIVVADRRPTQYDATDAALMQTVADQVAAALRGVLLREQLADRAEHLEELELRHRSLLERLVRDREEERSEVATDLHDDTVQVLSACVIALDSVRRSVEAGEDARAVQNLRDVSRMITGAAERARRMTFELRPAMLWHHGLVDALQHLLATMEQTLGMRTSLHVEGLDAPVEPALEAILFRTITAVLANVRQHAQASTVEVSLVHHDGELVASVLDDGRGFVVGSALGPGAPSHALTALMERLEAAGGSLTVTSSPGEGTAVRIALPVRHNAAL